MKTNDKKTESFMVYKIYKNVLFFLCVNIMPVFSFAQVPDSNYVLVYEDNFNGSSLNVNDWYYRDQDVLVHGGYNQKENVSVETDGGVGYLRIDYNKWDVNGDGIEDVVGGGIMSKKTFGYGYYEAKIKFHDTSKGFHQSFWTTGLGNYSSYSSKYEYNEDAKNDLVPWVNSALEIDAIELDSNYNKGGANFHWHKPSFTTPTGAHKSYSSTYINTNNWITIGFEWKPGLIIYYIDGIERHRFSYSDSRYAAQEVWLSGLANNTSYFGGGGLPTAGACMKVDYFRFYTKPVEGNIIGNHSFELNNGSSEVPLNWIQNDGVYNNLYADEAKVVFDGTAFDGSGYLKHECQTSSAFMTTKYRMNYIPNKTYKLRAWVQSSGGLSSAKMRVLSYGGIEKNIDIPETSTWTKIVIDDISVINNTAVIAFTTSGDSGDWIKVDKVELVDKDFDFQSIIIDNGDSGYSENGTWLTSSLTGYDSSDTRYVGSVIGSYAQWTPTISEAGDYDVYIYKVVNSNSDTNAKILVSYKDGTDTQYINYSTGASGWVYLGRYNFEIGISGFVRNSLNTTGKYARADAVKFIQPSSTSKMSKNKEDIDTIETDIIFNDFQVSPNPVKDFLKVDFPFDKKQIIGMSIIDVQGRIIWSNTVLDFLNDKSCTLDMSNFQKGLYILKVEIGSKVLTKKIVKIQ